MKREGDHFTKEQIDSFPAAARARFDICAWANTYRFLTDHDAWLNFAYLFRGYRSEDCDERAIKLKIQSEYLKLYDLYARIEELEFEVEMLAALMEREDMRTSRPGGEEE